MMIKPVCILVTGFGAFPGARTNPTARLIHTLRKDKSRLARFGVEIELHILPVVYAAIAPRLRDLTESFEPDGILHFGLAARRKQFCVETRAVNRVSTIHPDATGARAGRRSIVPGAAFVAKGTFPSSLIAAALRRAGIEARLSHSAGDYVCNQTFYLSLATTHARSIGFIHTPRFARRRRAGDRPENAAADRRPTLNDATRAALIAILVMAAGLRRDRASKRQSEALAHDAEEGSRHDYVTTKAKHFHIYDDIQDNLTIGRASA